VLTPWIERFLLNPSYSVLFSVLLVVTALGSLVAPLQGINKAAAASTACFKIIDAPQLPKGGLKYPEAQATSDIRFENVRFTYPGRPETAVLKGLDLSLPAGKITALVGPSGSGKSTIVGLLERWYQLSDVNELLPPVEDRKNEGEKTLTEIKAAKKAKKNKKKAQKTAADIERERKDAELAEEFILQNSGAIFVGQHNIETLDRKWWRSQIGLVQQEPFLFNETILNNVTKGLIGSQWEGASASKKQELVEEACKEAFADEFIHRLPNGYQTMVGESGIKLSGGQRQRLAIARSIVKRPAILILDEATSSIDVRGERIVQAALDRVSKDRTTVTIAHRLSTIKKADRIVVLKDGAAVEEGTHDELVSQDDGVYTNLVRAQHLELGAGEVEQEPILEEAGKVGADITTLERSKSRLSQHDGEYSSESPDTYKPRGFFSTVGRFLYEQRRHRLIYASTLLGAMGGGAVYATEAYLFSHLIVVFQYTGSKLIQQGNFWALMFFVLALFVAVCYALIGFCTNSLSVHVSTAYRQEYFESILGKPIPWFDGADHSSGTLTARLSNDPQQLQEILGPNMALPLIAIFNITACVIISFVFGWKLTLVTLFAALPVIFAAAFLRLRYEMQFEAFNAKVFAQSSQFAAESIGAFRTVTALTLEDAIAVRYQNLLTEHVDSAFKKGRLAVLVFALSDSLALCCMALSFWYGGQLLGGHEYDVTQFFVIYIAIVQGGQAAGQFLAFGPNIAQATAASNRILGFRGEPEVRYSSGDDDKNSSTGEPGWIGGQAGDGGQGVEIEFHDIGFQYPTRDVPVYRHLSLTIGRGEYVAFVGPSGCGKTTVINLLERFYNVSSGSILIDSMDIAKVPLAQYRSACALVSQEPTLFEGTVRENLVLGLPGGARDEDVAEACRAAEIHDFITSLSQSYATPLSAGTHASLSGGQKQRLCIARALLRKPRLLLLDEATSSLDSQSESLVQKAIERVAGSGKVTIVVVAHRLATVQNAGRIVVLGEGGRILEEGGHGELVKQRGVYWGMCRAQALDR
jgi:ATP-binding cassette subfamily B (MDR/TAP) protein 1